MKHPQNWTIPLAIGVVSNLLILLTSCSKGIDEKPTYEKFTYVNKSNHYIQIEKYKNNQTEHFQINVEDSLVQEIELIFGSAHRKLVNADSVRIVFDEKTFLLFNKEDTRDINILNRQNYAFNSLGNTKNFRYVFSEKDYENAEDLDSEE